jgi:hypothetical protein
MNYTELLAAYDVLEGKFERIEAERDALSAQVEVQQELLRCWQSWLGASRAQCDDSGKLLWDKIDAACTTPAACLAQAKADAVHEFVNYVIDNDLSNTLEAASFQFSFINQGGKE